MRPIAEERREKMLAAASLLARGFTKSEIARTIDVSRQTLDTWIKTKKLDEIKKPETVKTPLDAQVSIVQTRIIKDTERAMQAFQLFDGDVLELLERLKGLITHITNKAINAMQVELGKEPLSPAVAVLTLKDIRITIECVEKMRGLFADIAATWGVKDKPATRIKHFLEGFDLSKLPDKELQELRLARDTLEGICERHRTTDNTSPTGIPSEQ